MTAEVQVEEKMVAEVVAPQEENLKALEETVKVVINEEETEKVETVDEKNLKTVEKTASFKEESNFLSDLKESERKALNDFKSKLEEAIVNNALFKKDDLKKKDAKEKEELKEKVEEAKKENEEEKKTEEETEEKAEEAKIEVEEEKKTEEKTEEKAEEAKKEAEDEKKTEDKTEEKAEEAKLETGEEKKTEEKTGEKAEEAEKEAEEENKIEEKTEVKAAEGNKPEESQEEEKKVEEDKAGEEEEEVVVVDRDISLWGVPLLPSKGADGTDVILLKFLRARDFKVNEAYEMLKKSLQWRKQHKIDSILDEDFGADLKSAAHMTGVDREGHPVCYNIHGVFENEELYQNTLGTEEKREMFLRWRYQLMERGIEKLDLKPGGVTSLLQINDLKNSPGLSKKELRVAMKQAVQSLQDNYPEFVARNIFINVPFWFYALNALLSPFLTQRTKSKFVVARPARVTETLLKYIPVEEIPAQYGGFKRENDLEFPAEETVAVSELAVGPGSTETIEIPANETGTAVVWDIMVVGWEVKYKEEFVPADEGSYTVIIQKGKKIGSNEGPIRNNFRNNEAGKVVLTIENASGKKKRVLYRFKTKNGSSC